MHHPFYDPSKLTDNELLEKHYELVEKQQHAFRMNMGGLADNISALMYEIKMEQERRLIREEAEYNERNNIDPHEPITLGEIEELDPTEKDI